MNNRDLHKEFKLGGRVIVYMRISNDDEIPCVQAASCVVLPAVASDIRCLLADYGNRKIIQNEVKK